MASVTKNGVTITFPDKIEAGKTYEITYSVGTSSSTQSRTTEFWIITKSGAKKKFTITQSGKELQS